MTKVYIFKIKKYIPFCIGKINSNAQREPIGDIPRVAGVSPIGSLMLWINYYLDYGFNTTLIQLSSFASNIS